MDLKVVTSKTYEFLRGRKRAYQMIPEEVIRDLAKFCRATETCFHEDPRLHAVLEGRREVFLRIMSHRQISTEELYQRFGGTAGASGVSE